MERKESNEISDQGNDLEMAQLTDLLNTDDDSPQTPAAASAALNQDLATTNRHLRLSALAIVIIGALAYLNSFEGAFLFDDLIWLGDPTVRSLSPPWKVMLAPTHIIRPLIGLSLAINFAISATNPWSYHAFNLAAHLIAALTLFGIVRRTLLGNRLQERFGNAALPLALRNENRELATTIEAQLKLYKAGRVRRDDKSGMSKQASASLR